MAVAVLPEPEGPAAIKGSAPLWSAVEGLLDRAPGLDDLRAHRLHLLGAGRLRALGKPVPRELADEERDSGTIGLLAPLVLAAVRSACAGTLVVMKGPELAARYPDPASRPYADLDVLVADAGAAHRALRAAGFREVGDPRRYEGIHHLRPLVLPELPLPVEIHTRPKWVAWDPGPEPGSLLRGAVPGRSGVDGVSTLAPAHHALVVAAHSWAHEPLRTALDLVDVAALAEEADPAEVSALAAAWGLERVWRTTTETASALLYGTPPPAAARTWARGVLALRERTVFEAHAERWLSLFSARPAPRALPAMLAAMARDLRRDAGDSWVRKARRSTRAVVNAKRPRSHHHDVLDRIGAASDRWGEDGP
jgi:hypothetical protein